MSDEGRHQDPSGSSSVPKSVYSSTRVHKGPVHVARLNSAGRYLLTGGADRQIHLFNATSRNQDQSMTPIKTYSSHSGTILGLSISQDNAAFVSGGEDRNVIQWDVASGSAVRRFSAHTGATQVVEYCGGDTSATNSPSEVLLTAGFDTVLRFYDLRARGAWKPIMESKEAKDTILCAAVRGHSIYTGCVDGVLRTYDLRAGQLCEDTFDRPIMSVTPSGTATSLLVSTLASTDPGGDSLARHIILDVADGSHLQTIHGGPNARYRCHSILWDNDATIIAGDEKGQLQAWDVLTANHIAGLHVPSHDKAILWTERASKANNTLVTAGADGVVKVWGQSLS